MLIGDYGLPSGIAPQHAPKEILEERNPSVRDAKLAAFCGPDHRMVPAIALDSPQDGEVLVRWWANPDLGHGETGLVRARISQTPGRGVFVPGVVNLSSGGGE